MNLDAEIVDHLKPGAVRVPPYPVAVMKLQRLISDPGHSVGEVVLVLKADAALAGAVLRVANSAYYLRGEPVTTLQAAVGRVGESELWRLGLASGLSAQTLAPGVLAPLRRQAWHDAMTAAAVCELLAPAIGLPADELFVAGLLHDVGRMIALTTLEEILKEHPEEPPRTAGQWASVVERYHVELGLVLAAKWELPQVHADCISQHHETTPGGAFTRHVAVVAAADRIVAQLAAGATVSGEWLRTTVAAPGVDWDKLAVEFQRLPALVASFEDPATVPGGASKVVPEPRAAQTAWVPSFKLRLHSGIEAPCCAANARSVVFVSPTAMPDNFLQQLEVEAPSGKFPVWVKIVRCVPNPAGSGFEAEGQLFALSGPARQQWLNASCGTADAA